MLISRLFRKNACENLVCYWLYQITALMQKTNSHTTPARGHDKNGVVEAQTRQQKPAQKNPWPF